MLLQAIAKFSFGGGTGNIILEHADLALRDKILPFPLKYEPEHEL